MTGGIFPIPTNKRHYCHKCGRQLNPYGICPEKASHDKEDYDLDEQRKIQDAKMEKRNQAFQKMLDAIFNDKPLPPLD